MFVLKKLNLVGKDSEKMWLQWGKMSAQFTLANGRRNEKALKKKKELFIKAFKDKQGLRKFGKE